MVCQEGNTLEAIPTWLLTNLKEGAGHWSNWMSADSPQSAYARKQVSHLRH